MAINQRLDLKQSQNLTMTPQLQQAIGLLQLSNLELQAVIEAELEKNPLLERDESADKQDASTEDLINEARKLELDAGLRRQAAEGQDELGARDSSFEKDFHADESAGEKAAAGTDFDPGSYAADIGRGGSLKFENPDFSYENTLSEEKTLRTHLLEQIQIEFDDTQELAIAALLLDHLDESGYLRADLAAIAARLGSSLEKMNVVLKKLQGLDPAGIFARGLSECLELQLRDKNRFDPAMQKLLENLEVLAAHDFKKLQKICGVTDEDLKDMIAEIKDLNPRPASAFDHFVTQTVIPDVLMRKLPKDKGGGWGVELNADTLPKVLVNQKYYAEIVKGARSKSDTDYLSEQMNAANWLIKALDQRAQTIMKVATEIIIRQEAFFTYGVEYLKPLVLRDIAEAIGMHESTISRVTTNKYIGTPRGLFELKFFFSSGVTGAGGAAEYASGAVKARIKTLIDAEVAGKVLSDDDLVDALKKEGVDIARRTVAKYRESLRIPSSVQRRRQKNS